MKPDRFLSQKQRKKKAAAGGVAVTRAEGPGDGGMVAGVCCFLAVMVWAVFGQTLGFGFVDYDDPANVSENPDVAGGLSWKGVVWAFTHTQVGHWDPLTTISHMADCEFYGLDPSGHHLTNVILHGVSAIVLFLLVREMTSALWRGGFVAAVFAVHPLRVESVAWVTERKDVLSGLFFLLTLWAYVRYARRPGAWRYGAVAGLFALGLMCKAMLVTLPAVLLLLDWWPLGRTVAVPFRRLVWEKMPLFALSAVSCAVQMVSAKAMIATLEGWPLSWRLGNAAVSVFAYIGDMLWPARLAVYYPHPQGGLAGWEIAAAALLLVCVSAVAWAGRRGRPYVLTGWLWFLGMLVPVIGIVQSGTLARADRYTYLPHIGLSVALAWLAADLCAGMRLRRWVLGGAAAAAVVAMVWRANGQAMYWRDSHALWTRALSCTKPNEVAHGNLGHFFLQNGRWDEAEAHLRRALEIKPRAEKSHNNLGMCFLARGKVAESIPHFQRAVEISPRFAQARSNLGSALLAGGRADEAIVHYLAALEGGPDMPGLAGIENNVGGALLLARRPGEAITHFERAIGIEPGKAGALRNLAWVLATCPDASLRNGARAVALAERANQLTGGGDPLVLGTLAAAYAEAGRFPEAVEAAGRAMRSGNLKSDAAERLRAQMRLFQASMPFHEEYEVRPWAEMGLLPGRSSYSN